MASAVATRFQGCRPEEAVLNDDQGEQLLAAVEQTGVDVQGQTYKKVPTGLPAEHLRANWLRHTGLFAASTQPVPAQVFDATLSQLCFEHFQRLRPLRQWLVDLLPD